MATKQCVHKHSTLVQTWLDEGDIIAVYQCDMCGETLLEKDIGNIDDLLTLPLIDLDFQRQSLQRRWKEVFSTINKASDY
jgi:hypothetical protein